MLLSERLCAKSSTLATTFCTFFAMWAAFRIRKCLNNEVDDRATQHMGSVDDAVNGLRLLPSAEEVRKASGTLLTYLGRHDQSGIRNALEQMGVLRLCPDLRSQFAAMRELARSMKKYSQIIALTELALFAVEAEDYNNATSYVAEVRSLGATESELYSISIVEGLIEFSKRNYRESAQLMRESVNPCLCNEYVSLECGVRAINITLPERLLGVGYRNDVSNYLADCRDIWLSLRPQIDVWISLLNNCETPDFRASRTVALMNTPSFRLKMQWAKASFLENEGSPDASLHRIRRSRSDTVAARERLQVEYRRIRDMPRGGGSSTA